MKKIATLILVSNFLFGCEYTIEDIEQMCDIIDYVDTSEPITQESVIEDLFSTYLIGEFRVVSIVIANGGHTAIYPSVEDECEFIPGGELVLDSLFHLSYNVIGTSVCDGEEFVEEYSLSGSYALNMDTIFVIADEDEEVTQLNYTLDISEEGTIIEFLPQYDGASYNNEPIIIYFRVEQI